MSGRMLSVACAAGGEAVYAGSYSNVWFSGDGGLNWDQAVTDQPPLVEFDAPGSIGGWCAVDLAADPGWRVDRHPRCLAQLTSRGRIDIVGFGECGVWTALGNGDGTFQRPRFVVANLGFQQGWRVDRHPRFVADLTGNGTRDLVGFGIAGVWTALGNGDGTFQEPQLVLGAFGEDQGWRVDRHPRFVADLTGDGPGGLLGFGPGGVWTALGNGDGTFQEPRLVLHRFGYAQGWRVNRHPRIVADLGGGPASIAGFGDRGVVTALGNGDGTFQPARPALHGPGIGFGYDEGWRVDRHPRMVANLTGGAAGIVGFGDRGVWTALGNGDGTFQPPRFVLENFGFWQGCRVDRHPRFVADLTGDGTGAIVGCGIAGVWTALGNGDGTFQQAQLVLPDFGEDEGWRVDRHPRFVTDLNGDGLADLVGFGDGGVVAALGMGDGSFQGSRVVLPNFGYLDTVLALVVHDRVVDGRGLWRSGDGGHTWEQVHRFPSAFNVGQLAWALGSDHLVYAAGGTSLAISDDGGHTFRDVYPWGSGGSGNVNHVAVWQDEPADPAPLVIYALGQGVDGRGQMFVSFDGGDTWVKDQATLPESIGGPTGFTANGNAASVMVISPLWPLTVYVTADANGDPALWRGEYAPFFDTPISAWSQVVGPDLSAFGQDSGNVFLAATGRRRGDLLFYGPQRSAAFVGPLYPSSPTDWRTLDTNVHADLHGIVLSPDFVAIKVEGAYLQLFGMVWLLNDGGISWSVDGGLHFEVAHGVSTLSSVNAAGAVAPASGPALSLNAGDNDGFYSLDGGATWVYQQYGGGDNDCSFADPLRPSSMLVFTPRWNLQGVLDHTRYGQTVTVYEANPGSLPDGGGQTSDRRAVTGPPLLPDSVPWRPIWNASSWYANRGFRPVVAGLAGEPSPAQGDYVFILFGDTESVLVRTQNILDIASRSEWDTTATGPGQGATVYRQGPPLPDRSAGVVQASGGHAATVFYVGLDDGMQLWTWTQGSAGWKQLVPGLGANRAIRFFVDPYRPNLVYLLDDDHVKRSDDAGATWVVDAGLEQQLTWDNRIPRLLDDDSSSLGDHFDLVLTDMAFDPSNPAIRFAVGEGGAFCTTDGVAWTRLLHAGAMPGRPANCIYDPISDPNNPALYVAFAGRGLVRITDLPIITIY